MSLRDPAQRDQAGDNSGHGCHQLGGARESRREALASQAPLQGQGEGRSEKQSPSALVRSSAFSWRAFRGRVQHRFVWSAVGNSRTCAFGRLREVIVPEEKSLSACVLGAVRRRRPPRLWQVLVPAAAFHRTSSGLLRAMPMTPGGALMPKQRPILGGKASQSLRLGWGRLWAAPRCNPHHNGSACGWRTCGWERGRALGCGMGQSIPAGVPR